MFVRPEEIADRAHFVNNFFPNEVFITDKTEVFKSDRILGRCYVTFLVDHYYTRLPENAEISDSFICRSFYIEASNSLTSVVPSEIATFDDEKSFNTILHNPGCMISIQHEFLPNEHLITQTEERGMVLCTLLLIRSCVPRDNASCPPNYYAQFVYQLFFIFLCKRKRK